MDHGNEFKNQLIVKTLNIFNIKHSLSMKRISYENVVEESIFKTIKIEFVKGKCFNSMEELRYELFDYWNWFNKHRLYFSLGYQTPLEYKMSKLRKMV